MITIGQIVKPQGVRGEVKVRPMTDDPSRFCVLKTAFVGKQPYKISGVRVGGNDVFIKFADIDDRNAAEELRGLFVSVDRAAAVPLEDGEFFIADLIGAELVSREDGSDIHIGEIKSVQSFGAADVFTVGLENGKEMTFAFVEALGAVFDSEQARLCVDGKKLKEVTVYDED